MQPVIEFCDISKSFGKKRVLNKIDLKIYHGDIFGLLGGSGSGKSTLTNILLGICKPDSGKVLFNGVDITGDSYILRKIVGLTTQENSFYDKLTVYENMMYYSNLYRVKKPRKELKKHIDSILSSVALSSSKNTLAESLSGGMKRRLDFAISIVHNPELLILDEPTTGLDPLLVKQFWDVVKKVGGEKKTILVISHIFSEIKENCNRVGILSKGVLDTLKVSSATDLMKEFSERAK
ncbi:ABC transporter ATP-binding protein [Candidatus Woesearchaeota archaeon]|nr:ABC transporter ATP-binding protein [Candidatus Woesearchaeota archaeon]